MAVVAQPSAILIVDQHVPSLVGLRRLFEGAGHRVFAAATGTEALRIIEGERVDVVVTDAELPDMSGPWLLAAIWSGIMKRPLGVIVTSVLDGAATWLPEAGVFFRKPLDFEAVESAVARLVRGTDARFALDGCR